MITVSSGFKSAIKEIAVFSNGKVDLISDVNTISFTSEDITKIEIYGSAFQNDKVLGNIAQHSLTLELLGDKTSDINLSIENRLQVFVGVLVSGVYEYVKYQDFFVVECSYSDTSNLTRITATDGLIKLNNEFVDTNEYPTTLLDYATSVLTYCGLNLENISFINSDFVIADKPFTDYESCREIISRIAEMALSFVVINKISNKVQFMKAFVLPTSSETISKDYYWNLSLKDHNFGANGINTLVLGISQVDGENDAVQNSTNAEIDGSIEVVINDNNFIDSAEKRMLVIGDMFTEIDQFKYSPYSIDYRGFPYLELGDVITITKMDDSSIVVPIYEYTMRYDGGLFGSLSAKVLDKVQTSNKYISNSEKKIRNAEIMVDKANGNISILANEISVMGEDLASTNIEVNGITSTVSSHTGQITQIRIDVNGVETSIISVDEDLQQVKTVFRETANGAEISKLESKIKLDVSGGKAYIALQDSSGDTAIVQTGTMYIKNGIFISSMIVGVHKLYLYESGGEQYTIVQKIVLPTIPSI